MAGPMKLQACLVAIALTVPLPAEVPGSFTSVEARAVDRVAQAELKASGAPGMVLVVLRGDRVAYLKAYGSANTETGEAMDPGRLASVASITKLVTAATAVTLAAEGKLDLRAPIRDQLPGLPERVGLLTMAQLLSHTSGLSENARPDLAPGGDGSLLAVGKGFKDVFLSEPGTVWSYCNAGYTLAGAVLEAVAGEPFPAAVARRVLRPLGMEHSTFDPRVALTWPLAQGHDTRVRPARVSRPYTLGPSLAGGLASTVGDLARLARALMGNGVLEGRRVLPGDILAQLTQVRGHGGALLGGERDYGFGLFLREHRRLRIAEHEGLLSGSGASFVMAPERELAAIALCNGRLSAPCATTQAALEIAAGLEPSPTEPVHRPLPPALAARLAGRYSDGAGEELELRIVDGRLGAWEKERFYPVLARQEGHLEILGFPDNLPMRATPLELLDEEPGRPQQRVRLLWGLLRRVGK